MARTKQKFEKCSVKGCRQRAIKGGNGKCRKHEKGDIHVQSVVHKIKKVRRSGTKLDTDVMSPAAHKAQGSRSKVAQAVHVITSRKSHPGKKIKKCCPNKGALNAISYWAGVSLSNCTVLFKSKEEE